MRTGPIESERSDGGFTLIELMVVVLIIGILMAVAVPSLLGARSTASARAAESNLRNATTTEATFFASNQQTYGAASDLTALDSGLTFVVGTAGQAPATGTTTVTVYPPSGSGTSAAVLLGDIGSNGNAYYVYEQSGVVAYRTMAAAGVYDTLPTGAPSASDSTTGWAPKW